MKELLEFSSQMFLAKYSMHLTDGTFFNSNHQSKCLKSVLLRNRQQNKQKQILILNISVFSFSDCCHIKVSRIQLVVHELHNFHNSSYLLRLDRIMWTILPLRIAFHKVVLSCRFFYSLQKIKRHFALVWNFPPEAQKALPNPSITFHNLCGTG